MKLEAPPLEHLDAEGLTALLGQVEALKFRILRRLDPPAAAPAPAEPAAGMVDIAEASKRIGMSTGWLYRNARKLPFAHQISNRWRFNTRGLDKFLRDRQASP